jgi:nucleoside-diphosphate-sugar epimerase
MHVLIIGGTRFVGSLLAWRLLARGDEVTLLNRGTLPDTFGTRVERIRCDRTTPDFQSQLAGGTWDACVDFAAYTGADAEGAVSALGDRVGHYVFISTGQVYLVRDERHWPAAESDYDGPLMPRPADDPHDLRDWEYGVFKRDGEDVLTRAWREHQFPATRIRIPMVNGERDHYRRIESYLWRLLDGGPVLLPEGGANLCRHVYGMDVARTITGILGDRSTFGQAYNLSQEEQPTLAELLTRLAELLGAPARLVPVSNTQLAEVGLRPIEVSPFSDSWMSRLDPSKARQELGFAHTPLETYLQSVVAHFLARPPEDRPANYQNRPAELRMASERQFCA